MDGRDRLVCAGQRHFRGGDVRGHDRIIEARRQGRAPAVGVMFDLTDTLPWFDWLETKAPGMPVVWIEPFDKPRSLDLRFAIGLRCVVVSEAGRDWTELAESLVAAKAAEVVVTRKVDGETGVIWSSHADHQ